MVSYKNAAAASGSSSKATHGAEASGSFYGIRKVKTQTKLKLASLHGTYPHMPSSIELAEGKNYGQAAKHPMESFTQTLGAAAISDTYNTDHLPILSIDGHCFDNDKSYYGRLGHQSQDHCVMYRPSKKHLRRTEHGFFPTNPGITGCCNHHNDDDGLGNSFCPHRTLTESSGLGSTLNRTAKTVKHRELLTIRDKLKQEGPSALEMQAAVDKYHWDLERLKEITAAEQEELKRSFKEQLALKAKRLAEEKTRGEAERTQIESDFIQEKILQRCRRQAEIERIQKEMDESEAALRAKKILAIRVKFKERARVLKMIVEENDRLRRLRMEKMIKQKQILTEADTLRTMLEELNNEANRRNKTEEKERADRIKTMDEEDKARVLEEKKRRDRDCYVQSMALEAAKAVLEAKKKLDEDSFNEFISQQLKEEQVKLDLERKARQRQLFDETRENLRLDKLKREKEQAKEIAIEKEIAERERLHALALEDAERFKREAKMSTCNADLIEQMHYNTEKYLHEAAMR